MAHQRRARNVDTLLHAGNHELTQEAEKCEDAISSANEISSARSLAALLGTPVGRDGWAATTARSPKRQPAKQDTIERSTLALRPTAQIARHPIHPMLVPIPIVCFIGALITDIAYVVTADIMWADFSAWLRVTASSGG
jgi:hypothetical protein